MLEHIVLMNMRFITAFGTQVRHMVRWDAGAMLVVTLSVQGIVIGSQLLAAFLVSPEVLGAIRWLESAFAILLLVASCGMPAVAFRETALCEGSFARRRLFVRAISPTLAVAFLIFFAGCWTYLVDRSLLQNGLWVWLIAATGVLFPANVARVGIAMIQGAQLARSYWLSLMIIALAGTTVLVWAAFAYGIKGWVAGRYAVECALAIFVIIIFFRQISGSNRDSQRNLGLRSLLGFGVAANFALTIRAFCDNLPILLLKSGATTPMDLGFFGFASLLLFAPLLLMSVFMQLHTPKLVALHRQPKEFRGELSHLRNMLLTCGGLGLLSMALFAMVLRFVVESAYEGAALAMFILAGTLPFRAIIMTSGAALVACGRYGTSSIITFLEVMFIVVIAVLAEVTTANAMATTVLSASVASALLAVLFIQWNDRFLVSSLVEIS